MSILLESKFRASISLNLQKISHKMHKSQCCDDILLCMQIHFILQEMDISSSENLTACRILPQFNWPLFQVSFFLSSYVVPLTLIIGLYICMLLRLWRGSRISAESRRGRKRVTRLVVVVVGVFALCWLPIQVKRNAFFFFLFC